MTVAELLERISSRELSEWMAFETLEPFGYVRDNMHAGIVAAAVVNMARDPKKSRAVGPGDFVIEPPDEKPPMTEKQVYNVFRTWALAAQAQANRA